MNSSLVLTLLPQPLVATKEATAKQILKLNTYIYSSVNRNITRAQGFLTTLGNNTRR